MNRPLWWVFCINLWGFAIFGVVFTILGIFGWATGNDYGRNLMGQDVQTPEQNFAWLVLSLAFSGLGGIWIYLQCSGKILFTPNKQDVLEPTNTLDA